MTDYTPYLPPYDPQHSPSGTDAVDCVTEASVHSAEIQMGVAGKFRRFSPRALAKMDDTTPAGNNIGTVFATLRDKGLIPYELWPDLDTFTWDQYYADIPQDVLNQAIKLTDDWNLELVTDQSKIDLNKAPVILQMWMGNTTHFVVQFNDHQYFDTYQPAIKEIDWTKVKAKYQIILTPKTMPQIKSVNIKGEERIFLAAANPDEFQALCNIFGKDPKNLDVTV